MIANLFVVWGFPSRWAGQGGSDRTVQRFCAQDRPWAILLWVFFRQPVYRPNEVDLLVGDEGVATKVGTYTHSLDRCFARLYGKLVPGWPSARCPG
jgi:putative transposase